MMAVWPCHLDQTVSVVMKFEDDFVPSSRLPDSTEYLATLGPTQLWDMKVAEDRGTGCIGECKLAKLKQRQSKEDLVQSLGEKHKSCMQQLLSSSETCEIPEELNLGTQPCANALLRHIAPECQAIDLSELVELLKSDQLSQVLEEDSAEELTMQALLVMCRQKLLMPQIKMNGMPI
ncbi:unnamed protein product [Timema podura]|uniref:Uncharacterized protein n=1 Tax=Timema podura TaxID=61482 RepID=A0ABN7NRE4_TIMPD|nr:unnamed protein product [Timema podura]